MGDCLFKSTKDPVQIAELGTQSLEVLEVAVPGGVRHRSVRPARSRRRIRPGGKDEPQGHGQHGPARQGPEPRQARPHHGYSATADRPNLPVLSPKLSTSRRPSLCIRVSITLAIGVPSGAL